jgi:hypothetical protein
MSNNKYCSNYYLTLSRKNYKKIIFVCFKHQKILNPVLLPNFGQSLKNNLKSFSFLYKISRRLPSCATKFWLVINWTIHSFRWLNLYTVKNKISVYQHEKIKTHEKSNYKDIFILISKFVTPGVKFKKWE